MINNCITLLKVQLISFFGINEIRYSKDPKKRKNLLVYAIGMIILGIVAAIYSTGMAYGLGFMGMTQIIPSYMLMIISVLTLVLTMLKTNGFLFGFKDYDMVMSLPVKASTVIISRFMMMYVLNFLFECVVMIPAALVYAIYVVPGISYYIIILISLFIIPLIPMTIATALGAIVTAISCRFKHKNLLNFVLSFIFFFGILYLSMSSKNMQSGDIANLSSVLAESINGTYPFARLFTEAICNYNLLAFGEFVLISVGWFYIFVKLVSWKYNEINTSLTNHVTKRNYKMQSLRISSPFIALYKKEMKRYFTTTIYVFNTSFGVILLLIGAIYVAIFGFDGLEAYFGRKGIIGMFSSLAPLLVSSIISLSCTTSCAISLEGKNLWILKSSPINMKTIFDSKVAVNLTILLPPAIISAIVLAFKLNLDIIGNVMLFITPIIYSFYISIVGLLVNLKFPNYEWTSETVVVKQSAAILVAMIFQFISIIIPFVLVIIMPKDLTNYIIVAITVVVAAISGILYSYVSRQKI